MRFSAPWQIEFVTNPLLLIGVLILAGVLGGLVGYLMNNASIKWQRVEFLKSLFYGILISAAILFLLGSLYGELFIQSDESMLNLVLAGCICFMFAVVSLMFAYRFLMRVGSVRKKATPLKVQSKIELE